MQFPLIASKLKTATTNINIASASTPSNGQVLTATSSTTATWQTPAGGQTITLTGDITGTGTGSFSTTLANTTVSAGSYTAANITVDAKGRITAAANGSAGGGSAFYETNIDGQVYKNTIDYFTVRQAHTLTGVLATVISLPVGSNFQLDIRKNGTASVNSIFTSDTPLEIQTGQSADASGLYTTIKTTIDNGALSVGDKLYFFIISEGSTIPASGLYAVAY